MLAAVLYGPFDLRLEEVKIPKVGKDEVLIRVKAVGVCKSDIHYYETGRCGSFVIKEPLILGHECSGEVVEVGENVNNVKVGDRVAIEPGFPCRTCNYCKEGRYNLCQKIRFYGTPPINGCFAEYVVADADFVYKLPDSISFEEGALLEPLSVGIHAVRRGRIKPGDKVAVLGAGPIGLVTLQVAKAFGASLLISTDKVDYLLEAAEGLGADVTINVNKEDVVRRVLEVTGEGVDTVVEASGSPEALGQAMEIVKRGGTIVQVGIFPEPEFPVKMVYLVDKEIDLRGSFRYVNTYPLAMELVKEGKVKLKPLVTHVLPLTEIKRGFEIARKKLNKVIKVVIRP